MNILHATLHRLNQTPAEAEAVVVIDVLRSFSTAAYALGAGAGAVYPVATIAEAMQLQERFGDVLLVGALGGGLPVPGFHCGNSPSALGAFRLDGRRVVQHTAAGVQGLIRCHNAALLFAASLVCARATARALLVARPASVLLITTGEWVDRDGDEDFACADYLTALLRGKNPAPEDFARRVRESDFGRRFTGAAGSHLPAADLDDCTAVDRFDFAMRAERTSGHLRLCRDPAC